MTNRSGESGMTLMEMLAETMILAILVAAMGTGMASAVQTYETSLFQSESATVADILNTAMEDLLRFSRVTVDGDGCWITNEAYGISGGNLRERDGWLYLWDGSGESLLVNSGTYGNLRVADFVCTYVAPRNEGEYGWFRITYRLTDGRRSRDVQTAVHPLNEK